MITIKVMSDFSRDGLWKNELYTNIEDEIFSDRFRLLLKDRIEEWQKSYENMFLNFKPKSKEEGISFFECQDFKNYNKEGYEISKIIRNNFSEEEFKVIYFDEKIRYLTGDRKQFEVEIKPD